MKNLKTYELFENDIISKRFTNQQLAFINNLATGWTFNEETERIDIHGFSGNSSSELIKDNLNGVKFGVCNGNFSIDSNKLTTLDGCPKTILGFFSCEDNELTSLEGGPDVVHTDLYCEGNNLTSLKGFPSEIGGKVYINSKKYIRQNQIPIREIIESNYTFINYIIPMTLINRLRTIIKENRIEYSQSILKIWSELSNEEKKILITELPDSELGNVIKKSNKFGMNI